MKFSDEELIEKVQEWVKENKRLPETKDMSLKNGLFSVATLSIYFGGLKKLYERCGFTEHKNPNVASVEEKPKKKNCWILKRVDKPLCNGYLDARYTSKNGLNRKE